MSPPLPFNFDTAGVLDSTPRWVGVAGAIYVASQPSADPPPVLSVAWLDEPPDAHLDEVLAEELARLDPASVLIDYEPVPLNGVRAVRTLTIHREGSGRPHRQRAMATARRRPTLDHLRQHRATRPTRIRATAGGGRAVVHRRVVTVLWETTPAILEALRDPAVPAEEVLQRVGNAPPCWLAEGIAAARTPRFRLWTEGDAPPLTLYGGHDLSLLLVADQAALGLSQGEIPLALWGLLDLGPRRLPVVDAVRLAPGPMAAVIGRRQAHGRGLPPEQAAAWQPLLDQAVRHWSVRVSRTRAAGQEWRRNLEVLDGEDWTARVRRLVNGLIELTPTRSTELLRDLIDLVRAAAREPLDE